MDNQNADLQTEVQVLRTRLSALEQAGQERRVSRRRLVTLAAAGGLCVVLVAPQLLSNTPPELIAFSAGEPAVAADVNANFEYLDDRIDAVDGSICEALGGYWTGSDCEPYMVGTDVDSPVTGDVSNKWNECGDLDTDNSTYHPCSPFQAAALAGLFADFEPQTWYWLHPAGHEGQGGVGLLHRETGGVSAVNPSTCPADHSVAMFHDWGSPHVDGIECRADSQSQPVLCCRQPPQSP